MVMENSTWIDKYKEVLIAIARLMQLIKCQALSYGEIVLRWVAIIDKRSCR